MRQHFMQFTTSPGYSPLFDTYGKGAITGIDLLAVQAALLSQLPATDPTPPAQGGVAPSSTPNSEPAIAAAASPAVTTAGGLSSPLVKSPLRPSMASPTSGPSFKHFAAAAASPLVSQTPISTAPLSPTTPESQPRTSDLYDQVFEGLGTENGRVAGSLPAALQSVAWLNSLALSSDVPHGGWLLAHDSMFANSDSIDFAATSKRSALAH